MKIKLMRGDCLERMKEIPDGSVDLILTDPPYGTMQGLYDIDWDVALEPVSFFPECNRILRTQGALILFGQEPYTSRLITGAHSNIPFSYRMTWLKDAFANHLIAKKAPVNYTEDVCVFFKAYDDAGQSPIRDYAEKLFAFIGKPRKAIQADMAAVGLKPTVTSHFFCSRSAVQFGLPVQETYAALVSLYSIDQMPGFLSYEELVEWNKQFTRTFNLPAGAKYKSNVLQYKKDYGGLHPTQKPVALLEDLIKTYSNEGDTVLDFTAGSFSTGVAAVNLNRAFIGIEADQGYFDIGVNRIKERIECLSLKIEPEIK